MKKNYLVIIFLLFFQNTYTQSHQINGTDAVVPKNRVGITITDLFIPNGGTLSLNYSRRISQRRALFCKLGYIRDFLLWDKRDIEGVRTYVAYRRFYPGRGILNYLGLGTGFNQTWSPLPELRGGELELDFHYGVMFYLTKGWYMSLYTGPKISLYSSRNNRVRDDSIPGYIFQFGLSYHLNHYKEASSMPKKRRKRKKEIIRL